MTTAFNALYLLPAITLLAWTVLPTLASAQSIEDELLSIMDEANAELEAQEADFRVAIAEYITADGEEQGNTVFAKDVGNKQLPHHFVPGDPRRVPWSGVSQDIVYAVDTAPADASNLPLATTESAIDRAMGTWQGERCSNLPLSKFPLPPGTDLGVAIGPGTVGGDINHAGWVRLPPNVLGVTITAVFCSPCAAPLTFTDIDNNGKLDAAFREIYYNNGITWADDGTSNFDVESIALHEAGHGLSQAHFGKVFVDRKGNLKLAPRAVMNAVYTGPRRTLRGTDNGGHCSIWAQWPNN